MPSIKQMSASPRGIITTFYSYKGGTGRSMALANTACLLARETNLKVLLIDWDLEAPGLHHYFVEYLPKNYRDKEGLIEFFQKAYKDLPQMPIDEEQEDVLEQFFGLLDKYLIPVQLPDSKNKNLYLLKAGRFDEVYSSKVAGFDWQGFFQKIPAFFLFFARNLGRNYHHIFIDSRTGHTDTGGICTMLMPEKLVLVFTPNRQSLNGVIDLAHKAVDYRRHSDDTRPLTIYPLPSRLDLGEEKLRRQWQEDYAAQFEQAFREIYDLPEEISLSEYFEKVQIRHTPRFAYGEEIAVLHESSRDINAIAFSYQTLKNQLFGTEAIWKMNGHSGQLKSNTDKQELQIFISSATEDRKYQNELKKHLYSLKTRLNIQFWDYSKIEEGQRWMEVVNTRIESSDVFLLLISADFFSSNFIQQTELPKILNRYEMEGCLIIPIIVRACFWEDSPIAKFQIMPANGRPISDFENKDDAYVQVVKNLRNLIMHWTPPSSLQTTSKKNKQ